MLVHWTTSNQNLVVHTNFRLSQNFESIFRHFEKQSHFLFFFCRWERFGASHSNISECAKWGTRVFYCKTISLGLCTIMQKNGYRGSTPTKQDQLTNNCAQKWTKIRTITVQRVFIYTKIGVGHCLAWESTNFPTLEWNCRTEFFLWNSYFRSFCSLCIFKMSNFPENILFCEVVQWTTENLYLVVPEQFWLSGTTGHPLFRALVIKRSLASVCNNPFNCTPFIVTLINEGLRSLALHTLGTLISGPPAY